MFLAQADTAGSRSYLRGLLPGCKEETSVCRVILDGQIHQSIDQLMRHLDPDERYFSVPAKAVGVDTAEPESRDVGVNAAPDDR
ncbi:MAG: hypothetical protein EOP50_02085 [Sphingobacteriales bacterium]|nr:MAG: hypothetical protein EOP50_02085 [Sphingobacteriales bacterium]